MTAVGPRHYLTVTQAQAALCGRAGVTCQLSYSHGGARGFLAPAWAGALLVGASELGLPDDLVVAHLVRVKQDPETFTVGRAVLALSSDDPELLRQEMLSWARSTFEALS